MRFSVILTLAGRRIACFNVYRTTPRLCYSRLPDGTWPKILQGRGHKCQFKSNVIRQERNLVPTWCVWRTFKGNPTRPSQVENEGMLLVLTFNENIVNPLPGSPRWRQLVAVLGVASIHRANVPAS